MKEDKRINSLIIRTFFIILLLFLFSLTSCSNNQMVDEKILSEIFPQVIDSLRINKTNLIPPPPPAIYSEDSNFISVDSIALKQILEKQDQIINQIDSIDSRLLIALIDSSFTIDLNVLRSITNSDSSLIQQVINANKSIELRNLKWNIDLIQIPKNYQLISQSALDEKYTDIWKINDRKFSGIIEISRIYISNEFQNGILQLDYYPFNLEGVSYFILIEKIDKNWKIRRVLLNWIT